MWLLELIKGYFIDFDIFIEEMHEDLHCDYLEIIQLFLIILKFLFNLLSFIYWLNLDVVGLLIFLIIKLIFLI
jgi:hypothetical protein